jgi:hypothetical protein
MDDIKKETAVTNDLPPMDNSMLHPNISSENNQSDLDGLADQFNNDTQVKHPNSSSRNEVDLKQDETMQSLNILVESSPVGESETLAQEASISTPSLSSSLEDIENKNRSITVDKTPTTIPEKITGFDVSEGDEECSTRRSPLPQSSNGLQEDIATNSVPFSLSLISRHPEVTNAKAIAEQHNFNLSKPSEVIRALKENDAFSSCIWAKGTPDKSACPISPI